MKFLHAQREQILRQLAQLDTMEYGSLRTEMGPAPGGGTTGPYYQHQVWSTART